MSCRYGGCISGMERENTGSEGLHGEAVVNMGLEDWTVVWKLE